MSSCGAAVLKVKRTRYAAAMALRMNELFREEERRKLGS